jgi:signal transduction histidine kinase/CheY-like chemotaxis protein
LAGPREPEARLEDRLAETSRQLAEAIEQQAATSQVLAVIGRSGHELEPVFQTVLDNAIRLCRADGALVWRLDGDGFRVAATSHVTPELREYFAETTIPSRDPGGVVGRVGLGARPVHIPDVLADRDYTMRDAQAAGRYRTILGVPIVASTGVVGVITLQRDEVRPFSAREIEVVTAFAAQGAIAIENVRLFGEAERRAAELARSVAELEALGEISQAVSSSLDVSEVLKTIVTDAVRLSGAEGGSIFEFDAETELFHVRTAYGTSDELVEALRRTRIGLRDTLVGQAAASGEARQVPDISQARLDAHLSVLHAAGWRSMLTVPLRRGEEILGALAVRRRTAGPFPQAAVDLVETLANQSAIAIHNARVFRELEEKSRQLEIASRHKSEFLASMSHELRTPLNAVIGFSDVLLQRMFGDINDRQDEYLRDIRDSGRHLLELLNEILDLSKVEAGRMELELSPVRLATIIEHGLTMVRERAMAHGIELAVDIAPDLGVVRADELRMKQVVLNLFTNAVKFTPDGGSITVVANRAGDFAEVTVRDTGVGIPAEDQERIFDAFQQGARNGVADEEGTGLGLTLTKRIVELHGGRIHLASRPGEGSAFTFRIPVDGPDREHGAAGDERGPDSEETGSGPVVLVVEDDPRSLELLRLYLGSAGFRVVEAREGDAALKLAPEVQPAAIILDIMLPDRDGWDVLAQLKQDSATGAIPVIVASMLDEKGRGFALGAAEYLVKPVSQHDVLAAVRRCAPRHEGREVNVVVIDDDPAALALAHAILEPEGYRVLSADNGEAGVTLVRKHRPAVVLVDLLMPGVDGFAVIEQLRSSPETGLIPIVVLTAKTMTDADRERLRGQIAYTAAKGGVDGPSLVRMVRSLAAAEDSEETVTWPAH